VPVIRLVGTVLLLALLLAPLESRAAPPAGGLSEAYLRRSGLPSFAVADVRVYHSASALEVARIYGSAIAAALAWYRAELAWDGEIAVAVLDEADWQAMVALPYPVPHAERAWNLVVMPDSVARFPGFATWDLDAALLNEALTFHEVGHLLAPDLGLASGNHWIDELTANLFLAAYVRAARPDLAAILAGVPPRFANPGPFDQLFDLDSFYAGGGLENYAWFQFRLAALADRIVQGRPFAAVMQALGQAFPATGAGRRLTIPETLARLERVAPGSTALVADMAGDGVLPALLPGACPERVPAAGRESLVFLDNRGTAPLGYRAFPGVAPFALLPPGEVAALVAGAGSQIELDAGACLAVPPGYARYSPGG
jgi:hypothetical protein